MTQSTGGKPAFHIGLAMAGAVSAGAYSAGVLDFLIEALSEWQAAKDRGETVPQHDVFISTMSGSSAGGITAALGLAALAGGIRPVETPAANRRQAAPVRRVLPELYDVWVKHTKLFAGRDRRRQAGPDKGYRSLLDTGDLQAGTLPVSLLNSEMLTRSARATLTSIRPTGASYAFLTDPIHLFLTHTNLDGIPYPIFFEDGHYLMNLHEDRHHFAVAGLGRRRFPESCQWLAKWGDHGEEIDLAILARFQGAQADRPFADSRLESFATAALATSAYPFGLRAREVKVPAGDILRRALPFDADDEFIEALRRDKPADFPQDDSNKAHFVCVDGGTLNNEPFEIVRWTIRDLSEARNSRDRMKADRAVILIAPFPPESKPSERIGQSRNEDTSLDFVAKRLFPALVAQSRFKLADLIAASDPNVYSRFLISPKRHGKPHREPNLASELLGAFGGFLDEQFREHDFQLGRHNCQKFLSEQFTLHAANPVFGLQGRDADGSERPIVPLVGTAAAPITPPPWPQFPEERLADLRDALKRRLDILVVQSVVGAVFQESPIKRFGARCLWRLTRRGAVDRVMRRVRQELEQSNQLAMPERRGLWAWLKGWFRPGPRAPLTAQPT
jgi:predicted acylesterase/phospholipase RssA